MCYVQGSPMSSFHISGFSYIINNIRIIINWKIKNKIKMPMLLIKYLLHEKFARHEVMGYTLCHTK
jgi:hypothetical protein